MSKSSHPDKQAVVVVHGMGEQRPMDTILSFVQAVWIGDKIRTANKLPNPTMIWSKPDERTGSLELRRITTRQSIASDAFRHGVTTDFYELYWADLTADNKWDDFIGWVGFLLFRSPFELSAQIILAWLLLWLLVSLIAVAGLLAIVPPDAESGLAIWAHLKISRWAFILIVALVTALLHRFLLRTFARVARYTRSTPDNIAARAAIRERGLKLLEALHGDDDRYSRVIVVGHSLGSIVAYDIISFFWARRSQARITRVGSPEFELHCALELAGRDLDEDPGNPVVKDKWLAAQRAFRIALARPSSAEVATRWLISDFVTLGSPLAHAAFLLARDTSDLHRRKESRELPTVGPWREDLDPSSLRKVGSIAPALVAPVDGLDGAHKPRLFSFCPPSKPLSLQMHQAAPFAAVKWTNIYDSSRFVVFGDQISGPLVPVFGSGIVDIDLAQVRGRAWHFTHTEYWSGDVRAIACLRDALNLTDDPSKDPRWHVCQDREQRLNRAFARSQ